LISITILIIGSSCMTFCIDRITTQILSLQHRLCIGHWTEIIQISAIIIP
jgi:hypothetical protein